MSNEPGFGFPHTGNEEGGEAAREAIARMADSLQAELGAPLPLASKPAPTPTNITPTTLPLSLPPQGMSIPTTGVRPGPAPVAGPDYQKGKILQTLVKNLKDGKITKEQFSQQLIQAVGKQQALQIMTKTQVRQTPTQATPPVPGLVPGAKPAPQMPTPPTAPSGQPTAPGGQPMMLKMQPSPGGKLTANPIAMRAPGQPPTAADPQMQRLLQLQLQQQMAMGSKIALPSAEEQKKLLMMYGAMPGARVPQGALPQVGGQGVILGGSVVPSQPGAMAGQPPAKKARTGPVAGNGVKRDPQGKGDKDADKRTSLKDLNDVTRIAGVNLKEESNNFLASMPTVGESTEPDVDVVNPLLNRQLLQKKVQAIVATHDLQVSGDQVYELLTLAVAERMRDILERLATFSEHRQENGTGHKTTTTLDPRRQLRNIERREKEEYERRDEQLSSDISAKILGESGRQAARLQEEEDRMRTNANLTALQAIGDLPTRSRGRPPAVAVTPAGGAVAAVPGAAQQPPTPQVAMMLALRHMKPEQLQMMQRLQQMDKEGTINPQQKQQLFQFHAMLRKLQENYRNVAVPPTGGAIPTTATTTTKTPTTQVTMQDVAFLFQSDPYLRRKSSKLRHPLDSRPRHFTGLG